MPRVVASRVATRTVLVSVCVLFSFFASAQLSADRESTSSRPEENLLSGSVVNSVTAEPIRHALVQILGDSERSVLTDENGRFEFGDLPPGQLQVAVRKPGFLAEREVNEEGPTITTIGPDAQPLVLKLVPQGTVYGRVQNFDEEPVEGLPVKAVAAVIVDGRKRWRVAGQVSTNEDGEFRIANLVPGTYYLEAGPSVDPRRTAFDKSYPVFFYPGVTDIGSASPFEIGPGQQANANFDLRPAPLFKVSGTLTGHTANRPASIFFVDHFGNSFSSIKRFDLQTGQFEAEVTAGQYSLQSAEWGDDGQATQAQIQLSVTSDVTGIVLPLGTIRETPIIVRTEDTRLRSDGHRSGQNTLHLVTIHLVETGESLSSSEYWSTPQGRSTSSMVLPEVPPGTYIVEMVADDSWYVQSAECGSTDLLREQLTVANGSQIPPIDVVLRNDGATLTGRVLTAQSGAAATVILLPDHGLSTQIISTGTSPEGNFTVANLAPGNYNVFAFSRSAKLEYANPEVVERYVSRAAHVTLRPNSQGQISVDLINGVN